MASETQTLLDQGVGDRNEDSPLEIHWSIMRFLLLQREGTVAEKRHVHFLSGEGLTGSGRVYVHGKLPKEGEVLELCRESVHLVNVC